MRKKTVLITGGAGFIGSHMCGKLLESGYSVICLDNLITGSLDNIRHLFADKSFRFDEYNVCNYWISRGEWIMFCTALRLLRQRITWIFPSRRLKSVLWARIMHWVWRKTKGGIPVVFHVRGLR
jgi:nucleoside-diphosphate-sugar epimerase